MADRITVVVPVKDEEVHIARSVERAKGLGRVVVVDGGSSDRTVELARQAGAEVVEHPWEGYAEQKNWALENIGVETPWVLFLDADEYLPPEAAAEAARAAEGSEAAGYYLPRRYVFLGRELRHAWWYPDYQLRLFRPELGRFEERRVHEHVVVEGPVETLKGPIVHDNLKGLAAFVERHNRYSELEADELLSPSAGRKQGSLRGSWADRRRLFKERIWFRLPFRPTLRFLWLYTVKRGFLDGRRGLLFCRLIAMYDLLIDAKVTERKLTRSSK